MTDIDWNIEEGRNEAYDDLHVTDGLRLHTWNNNNNNKTHFGVSRIGNCSRWGHSLFNLMLFYINYTLPLNYLFNLMMA